LAELQQLTFYIAEQKLHAAAAERLRLFE